MKEKHLNERFVRLTHVYYVTDIWWKAFPIFRKWEIGVWKYHDHELVLEETVVTIVVI